MWRCPLWSAVAVPGAGKSHLAVGPFQKLLLQFQQSFVDTIRRLSGRGSDDGCDVLLELILVSFPITQQLVQGGNHSLLQIQLVDRSRMTFQTGRLQPADTAPNDGFAAVVVPMNAPEYLAAFAADDHLGKAVVAAIGAFLPLALVLTTRLRTSSSCTCMKISLGMVDVY